MALKQNDNSLNKITNKSRWGRAGLRPWLGPLYGDGNVSQYFLFNFPSLLGRHKGPIVLDHIILPIIKSSVAFELPVLPVRIFDVQSCVVRKIPECYFVEFFGENLVTLPLLHCQLLHSLLPSHLQTRNVRLVDREIAHYLSLVHARLQLYLLVWLWLGQWTVSKLARAHLLL